MWAISVLGNAKSNCHRKTHAVELGGAGRKYMHLTRGELRSERAGEVSRVRSSEDARRKAGGAKGRRVTKAMPELKPAAIGEKATESKRRCNCGSHLLRHCLRGRVDSRRCGGAGRRVEAVARRSEMQRNEHAQEVSVGARKQAVRLSLLDSTAVCGKPHVRWCGRADGRNPVGSTRSRAVTACEHRYDKLATATRNTRNTRNSNVDTPERWW